MGDAGEIHLLADPGGLGSAIGVDEDNEVCPAHLAFKHVLYPGPTGDLANVKEGAEACALESFAQGEGEGRAILAGVADKDLTAAAETTETSVMEERPENAVDVVKSDSIVARKRGEGAPLEVVACNAGDYREDREANFGDRGNPGPDPRIVGEIVGEHDDEGVEIAGLREFVTLFPWRTRRLELGISLEQLQNSLRARASLGGG